MGESGLWSREMDLKKNMSQTTEMCNGSNNCFLSYCASWLLRAASRAFLDSGVSVHKAREGRNKGLLFELNHQPICYNRYCSAEEIANYSFMTLTLTKL